MGSICYINIDPKTWKVCNTNKQLKQEYGGEHLYKIYYGIFDDDLTGQDDMEMLIRSSIYNCLVSGDYKVSSQSKFKRELIIQDMYGNEIAPLKAGFCY